MTPEDSLSNPGGGTSPDGAAPELAPEVLARVRAGDPEGLRRVYERYADEVYRVAFRLTGSSADAYDVAHDVFVGLPEAMGRYTERAAFGPWIRRVTARTALMRIRSRRRRREVGLGALPRLDALGAPEPALDRVALERAIGRLPGALREVYVLREIEGFSYEEIGEVLGIRRNTAEVRLHRARRHLRALLGGQR